MRRRMFRRMRTKTAPRGVGKQLHYGQDKLYNAELEIPHWNFQHAAPGTNEPLQQATNVMPDLAQAMKLDPQLHVSLNAGYFDLATPFYNVAAFIQRTQGAAVASGP